MDLRTRLHDMIDDVLGQDPRAALTACRELRDDQLPWLEQRVVALARCERWSWGRIARLLGRSRQTVHERFRTLAPSLPPDPLAGHRRWERDVARLRAEMAGRSESSGSADDDAVAW